MTNNAPTVQAAVTDSAPTAPAAVTDSAPTAPAAVTGSAHTALAVVTTVGDMETARRLARTIVEGRLAACVQLSAIESFYNWDGALQHEPEVRLVCKTTEAAWPQLHAALVAAHPYALPAIHAVRLDLVHAPYAQWLAEQTVLHPGQ